ncbi:MAG TPA: Flp family type IVb pilin [Mycobacteriales bacterium]|nr:Flp family type IVb pilin [Mycobacteriales bacterium]
MRRDIPMHYFNAAVARVRRAFKNDEGATAVEYGLMVALIAAVIAGVVYTLGTSLHDKFSSVNTCVNNAQSTSCNGSGVVSSPTS